MRRCPECHGKNVTVEQKNIQDDQDSVSGLVLRSWLQPGGIRKDGSRCRTETVCKCEDCGHTWKPRSKAEIGMAVIGAIILVCIIILEIIKSI